MKLGDCVAPGRAQGSFADLDVEPDQGACPAAEEGAASAAMQLANVLGVALGAGLGGAAVALADTRGAPPVAGFALGFATMLAAALATLGLARRLPGAPRAAV